MHKWRFLIGSLAFVISLFFVSAVSADTNYIVQYGDNLFRIAQRFGTTPQAIQAANRDKIPNINLIYAGDVLIIPTGTSGEPGTGGRAYLIRYGDTLYNIAWRHGTTVDAIMAANRQITNANVIYAGRTITIPGTSGTGDVVPDPPPAGNVYRIQPGDGLTGIARRYGTTVDILLQLNPKIQNRHLIFVGDTIILPGG